MYCMQKTILCTASMKKTSAYMLHAENYVMYCMQKTLIYLLREENLRIMYCMIENLIHLLHAENYNMYCIMKT